jgi:hypothetical protein
VNIFGLGGEEEGRAYRDKDIHQTSEALLNDYYIIYSVGRTHSTLFWSPISTPEYLWWRERAGKRGYTQKYMPQIPEGILDN